MRPVILGSAVFLMLILTIGGGGALAGRLTRPAALSQAAGPQVPSPASPAASEQHRHPQPDGEDRGPGLFPNCYTLRRR